MVISAPETPGAIAARFARPGLRDAGEGVHHAPNRSEQSEKRRTAHRGREQNHLRFELETRVSPTARSIAAVTAPIWAGEILSRFPASR